MRTWAKAEDAPNDVHLVEVDGHGEWERVSVHLFRHVDDVYKFRTFHRLRELGTVREIKS